MIISSVDIPGPLIIEPKVYGDERGFFLESWNYAIFKKAGLDLKFVQDNHSRSGKGVLRGVHFQNPNPQGKLVRVVSGAVWDVAVDLRTSSEYFGKWFGIELSALNKRMFWIPPGFGHGFLSLEDDTDFLYKCTTPYNPLNEHSLQWNDPKVDIKWPINDFVPQLSEKDRNSASIDQIKSYP